MITRFGVKNFKALRDVELELTPLHVLIGPNDSGKTSILQALAAVCRSVDMPLSQAFAGRWNGRELVWRDDPNSFVEFDIVATTDQGTINYETSIIFSHQGRSPLCGRESASFDFKSHSINKTNMGSIRTLVQLLAEEDSSARLVHDVLSDVQLYRWVPRFLALPNAPDSSRRFRMEATGFGLALCLDDILGYDRPLFDSLEKRFKLIFPEVEIIRLLPEEGFIAPTDDSAEVPQLTKRDGKGIYFQLANGGPLIPASQVSDGMLLILAYLTILHLPEPPRLLLIEEPENGIHPERLKKVLEILRDLIQSQQHTQVLMTTHSPYVVDMFKPEEVTLCFKGDDGAVTVRRLSESKAVREQVDVFTLGEIWTGDGDERLMEPAGMDEGAGE
ncbi:MAG: AAA family ATPase [Planctomycetes bacterium]|nr:AAA family ATPase [Planctomycetota bacterium]